MNNRDDTPSAFHSVRDTVPPLHDPSEPRDSFIPVLQVSKRAVFWRKARWPVFMVITAVVLLVIGLGTWEVLKRQEIDEAIAAAQSDEFLGSIEKLRSAREKLLTLKARYPDRPGPHEGLAWQYVLEALLYGPEKELADRGRAVLENAVDKDNEMGVAAHAGLFLLEGKHQKALDTATQGLSKYPGNPRLELVCARSLSDQGKNEPALEWLEKAMAASPGYVPLVITGVEIAHESGDYKKALELVEKLLTFPSEKYLHSSLITLLVSLPKWGDDWSDKEKVDPLLARFVDMKPQIDEAPPRLAVLGQYLEGRIYLLVGRTKESASILSNVVSSDPSQEYFLWYARATEEQSGPDAVLAVLDSRPEVVRHEALELRARALLAQHRVDAAAPVLEKLRDARVPDDLVKDLSWTLAVRKGNLEAALETMPEKVGVAQSLLAIDLYYQLKDVGDREGIGKLTDALSDEHASCAKVIKGWQSLSTRRALRKISVTSKNLCVSALAGRLLRGRVRPVELKKAIERAVPASGRDLRLEVDLAMATWLAEGHAAAEKVLNGIWESKPEGAPLRHALADAFIRMEMPKRALEVLTDLEDPASYALRFNATRLVDGKATSKIVEDASKSHDESPHPATTFVAVRSKYIAGEFKDVAKMKQVLAPHAGRWTSEIADMVAKSINLTDDRSAADRVLRKASDRVGVYSGMDEAWDVRLAKVRLNTRRGGKFARKAKTWLGELRRKGLRDPRVLFGLAMARIRAGDEKAGVRYLKDALKIDPTYKTAYIQLSKMEMLDEKTEAKMNKTWPGWSP
ncbi:MAG: hypothetical protein GY854_13265 [Deltaproteobacteria bacterium]|nr:hypothetical protein [Deltaproteobacteria bacterium]